MISKVTYYDIMIYSYHIRIPFDNGIEMILISYHHSVKRHSIIRCVNRFSPSIYILQIA